MAAVVFARGDGTARVRARERTEEGEEREGVRGGSGRLHDVVLGLGEEAGGGQGKQEVAGAASAPATHLFVLLAEEEDDKGEEVGWAGQMGWPAVGLRVGCQVS